MKPVSGRCNLDCKYCFYKQIDFGQMPLSVVRAVIKNHPTTLGWQGGEPAMAGISWFHQVMEMCPEHINHTFMTNGTLIDASWVKLFAQHDFLVGVSIDGPEMIHNAMRGEWRKTVMAIELLLESGVQTNTVVVVNRVNWNEGVRVYHFLLGLGITNIQFIPVISPYHAQGIDGYEWGIFLRDVFYEWLQNGFGTVSIQLFETIMLNLIGENCGLCVHSKQCGGFVVEANGRVFCCEHFIQHHEDLQTCLGNILQKSFIEMGESGAFRRFNEMKRTRLRPCRDCEFLYLCNSGCPKHVIPANRDSSKFNALCEGYKTFFRCFLAEMIPLR